MTIQDKKGVIISGGTVINGVLHRVSSYYVYCAPELNNRAWNTTEAVKKCKTCFPEIKQLELF